MYHEEECGCRRHHEREGGERHHEQRGWGEGHRRCGCPCHGEGHHGWHRGWGGHGHHGHQGMGFGFRRFISRDEITSRLEEYLKSLQAEAKAVEERIAELKKNQS